MRRSCAARLRRNVSGMQNQLNKKRIFLGDRLASGVLCALFAVATLATYLFFLFVRLGRASEGIFRGVFSEPAILFVPAAFVVGFLLGPERLATGFSFLWGTHPKWKQEPWRTRTILVLFLLLAVYLAVEQQNR